MKTQETSGDEYGKTATAQQLKRARITAITLGIASVVCMMLFVFAQIQTIEAKKNQELVIELQKQLEVQRRLAEESKLQAVENEQLAIEAQRLANEALEECQKKVK